MTKDQKLILEIEADAIELSRKADKLDAAGHGKIQQDAIQALQKSISGIWGFQVGELKNAFGLGPAVRRTSW